MQEGLHALLYFINDTAEYSDAEGASRPGNRWIKYFINDTVQYIYAGGLQAPITGGLYIS
jgi:hypothetical protein